MTNFGHLPKRGEVIVIDQFEFKVINADARRIRLLECLDLRSSDPSMIQPNNEGSE